MPTWGQILNEVQAEQRAGIANPFDKVRQKYLQQLCALTGRDVIVYASKWTSGDAPPNLVSIIDEDLQGFMEAIHGLKNKNLDLILHTGGGSAEATEAIVSYLRQKFDNIRIIIPQAAMSAGTMLACSADEILMGKHSFIGPIDPQFILPTPNGYQSVPAHAIIEQFEKAQKEIVDNPKLLSTWLPMLNQYGPALLIQCNNQITFGRQLVESWLNNFMFKGEDGSKASKIAEHLSNHGNFKTHSKHINNIDAKNLGLKISDLEESQELQESVLSVFHAIMINLNVAVKIICNHNGNAFVKQQKQVQIPIPIQAAPRGNK
ncbi:SDH family Clp fold serine proteinase [Ferruginibacter sp. SUN002]|uniref:SDH family Clp fold serine proteinase n=1 Tax=Ferruginibacter sp. SUN002 TaxID=2937789 RepID=UPI003D35BE69